MIRGISCLQFCKKSADHKEGNTCSMVPINLFCKILSYCKYHRYQSIHIERECLAVFTFAKLGCFVRQIWFFYFFTTQILGAVAADLLYKSVQGPRNFNKGRAIALFCPLFTYLGYDIIVRCFMFWLVKTC